MSRNIVYRRVSTEHQKTDRQFDGCNIIFDMEFEDKLSGKDTHRPELQKCLAELQSGDTLYVWEVSRLSRNLDDLRNTVMTLIERGVSVRFYKEGLDFCGDEKSGTKFALSKMQLTFMGSIAEFERAMIKERVKEGIAAAKARGVKFGGAHPTQAVVREREHKKLVARDELHKIYIENARKAGYTFSQIADQMNLQGVKSPRGSSLTATSVHRMAVRLGIC